MAVYIVRAGNKDTKVTLSDSDYVASGGEKTVYRKGKVAYCVYHDASKVTPTAKIDELAKVKHPGFITPSGLLLNQSGSRVGETMPFVDKTYVLCELFANAFRKQNKVNHSKDLSVLSQMFDITQLAHSCGVTLVDHNDMNWLVGHDFKNVSLVDTLSAQTPSFPATAIKAAIKDPFSSVFNSATDHYSLAVLSAWLWCGIHPFTIAIDGFKGGMPEKQVAMRSVFDSKAMLNPSVRPIDTMPDGLRDWVKCHLTSKSRPEPPSVSGAKIRSVAAQVLVTQGGSVTWEVLPGSSPWAKDGITYDFKADTTIRLVGSSSVEVNGVTGVVESASDDYPLKLHDGRIYLTRGNKLFEINYRTVNGHIRFSNREVASLADMPNATLHGEGCIVQDLLGRKVIHSDGFQSVVEMPGFKVLHSVAHGSVVMLTAVKNKKSHRVIISDGGSRFEEMPQAEPPNFCVTSKGVIVENRNGELIASLGKNEKRGAIPVEMKLLTDGSRVLGVMDGRPYQIRLN